VILDEAQAFYATLEEKLGVKEYSELVSVLEGKAPAGFDQAQWQAVQAAHAGYQLGTEIYDLLPYIACQTGFYDLKVNDDLSIHIPDRLSSVEHQKNMAKVLVPPPAASANEIVAVSGGMFYSRETPEHPMYVEKGSRFEAGQPLYIVEVMKMFNKVSAPFSGTIDEVLVHTDGAIIKKGQPLFRITPDVVVQSETPGQVASRKKGFTEAFLATI
jgi:biotin carboxyl carrier protein